MTVEQIESVKDYYSRVLSSKNDLKTTACCAAEATPVHYRGMVSRIHEEVRAKFYGCGLPIPDALTGKTVLDLGSGSGRDAYLLAQLVGPEGKVIGVDMTEEQLAVARSFEGYHQDAFGFARSNVEFRQGYIEDLNEAGIQDNSVDLVVSNCVINLSPDKQKVFDEIYRVLKPGGELYFSDVYTDRRLAPSLRDDPVVLGECLGGAMYTEDLRRSLARAGLLDARTVSSTVIDIHDPAIRSAVGSATFLSNTVRAFKLDLEDRCEDYGHVAVYKGSLEHLPYAFVLDDHHVLETGRPQLVCSNTAAMLSKTRFSEHFQILGGGDEHFGLFSCSRPLEVAAQMISATPAAAVGFNSAVSQAGQAAQTSQASQKSGCC